jgi:uncharacterized GH25 family protein
MKTSLARIALLLAPIVMSMAPATSHAARAWLLPSQTILARSGGWVAFDAASADDLFAVNQGSLSIDGLTVTGPDGQPVPLQNAQKSRTRNTFDLELRQSGTYQVAIAEDAVTARWEEEGKPGRWRGSAAEMAANIPANAAKLEAEQVVRRIETFVTVGSPTGLKAGAGAGIVFVPAQHPNDLYAGESAKLRFLLDGKPAADLEVEVIRGGTRYRDSPEAIVQKTDKDGAITITWPSAGMYWIEVSVQDEKATAPGVKKRRVSYNATLEVLPQ